jgi:intracellular multiplication protein IcmF
MGQNYLKQLFLTIRRLAESNSEKNLSFLIATSLEKQGSTSALKQAQTQHIHIDDQHDLNIFYNKQGIILEINQNVLLQMQMSLPQLFKKLNQCHRNLKISGFLFFIDISDLLIEDHHTQNKIIKTHINHMNLFIHALDYPVRSGILMTKLDQITGFTDYFSMAHQYELEEPLGFSLPSIHAQTKLSKRFNEIWSNFIDNLNHGVISKIHTTRGNKKRILIREFPLQIALLESKFLHMLKNITHPKAQMHGIYFTCSEQNGKNVNFLNQKIQNALTLTSPISSIQSVNYRHYFIAGAIQHCQALGMYVPKAPFWHDKRYFSIFGFGVLSSIAIFWMSIHSHFLLNDTAAKLKNHSYWNHHFSHQQKLSMLESCFENLQRIPFLFNQTAEIKTLKHQIYNTELKIYQNNAIAELEGLIKAQMHHHDIYQSYMALKVYKILTTQKTDESAFVIQWLEHHLKNKEQVQQIPLFKKFMWKVKWIPDDIAIVSTQSLLNALPPEYLAYRVIHHRISTHQKKIHLAGFQPQEFLLPETFTKSGFYQTQKALINGIAQYQKDSWILEQKLPSDLREKVLETYANQYVNFWNNIGKSIKPQHFNTFAEANQLFSNYEKKHSLEKIIGMMIHETAPNIRKQHDLFNQKISSQFTQLQFAQDSNKGLGKFWNDLKTFTNTFLVIDNHGQASFQYLRSYFNQTQYNDTLYRSGEMAKHLPEPLAIWLNQINDDIWLCLYQSTKSYLNEQWHSQIYQAYTNEVEKTYPFNETGQEISISKFEEYFSPNGRIQQFFREYLLPFINTNQAQWELKAINDKHFNLNSATIDAFIQANVITNMFFPNNASNTRIQFNLEKMSLDPVIGQLKLTIGEQSLNDNQQESAYVNNLIWPQLNSSLKIQTIDGQNFEIDETGYWGFFKLLQQVNVLADPNDPSALQILLEINGNSGRYLLKTSTLLNPFTPGILNHFKLEEKIIN